MKLFTPMELYHAARETCVRLYVMNGGDKRDEWTIQPYPGTAAISCWRDPYDVGMPRKWKLCMPAFPLDARLPRWQCDLIGAYTVHELLHALWTDWDVVRQSRNERLHSLVNAIEDNRIEARASKGDLVLVNEARRLLQALNAHIAKRAMTTPGFRLDAPEQFSFVLNLILFAEKLGYVSMLPVNWRAEVRPEWLPLFDLALARFDTLGSTQDALQLARDLKALAASLPKPPKIKIKTRPAETVQSGEGDGAMPHEPEIVEPELEFENEDAGQPEPKDTEPKDTEPKDTEPKGPVLDDAEKPADSQEPGEPSQPAPDMPSQPDATQAAPESDTGEHGGSEPEDAPEPTPDLSDDAQTYNEANLDDLSEQVAKDAGKSKARVLAEAMDASTVLNVPLPRTVKADRGGDPKRATAVIDSPAKLRRHLTIAVKSPERVGVERRQISGRLDMRNLVGLSTGAPNVFRSRVEEEGREAAVGILLDVSGSMAGERIGAAKAMALHMGDALKAAGVKFEICAFDDRVLVTAKAFKEGWAEDTRRKVAGLKPLNGTAMLPAMKVCAERLLKVSGVTRRILLVLTDGQDGYSESANAALCGFYGNRGVEITGIGLQTGNLSDTFRGKAVSVWDARALSTAGLSSLVRVLDEGAPRAG